MTTPPQATNVILIISDHHRWDYLGCEGAYFIRTPNLDRLAARGTRVERMYSTTPLCVPQRIAITTGRYPMNTGRYTNRHPVDPDAPTFLHRLRDAGVHTALIGKLHHHVHAYGADFVAHEPEVHRLGFDYVHETSGKQGVGEIACECRYAEYLRAQEVLDEFRRWTGRWSHDERIPGESSRNGPWPWPDVLTQDAYIAERACAFLRNASAGRAFYLHIGLVGPHNPFDAPQRFRDLYADVDIPPAAGGAERDRERWIAYAACISEVDEQVGRILDTIDSAGLRENTVVLYTSDHGDCAGDHGRWGKAVFYEGSVHVPFLAAGPGIPEGRTVDALAELIDIGATACDFAGTVSHPLDQGMSLKPLLVGAAERHRDDVFSEMGSDKMLFDGRYKLLYGDVTHDTRRQWQRPPYNGPAFGRPVNLPPDVISLFDLRDDLCEERDLASDPGCAPLLAEMKEKLLRRMICNLQAAPEGAGSVM